MSGLCLRDIGQKMVSTQSAYDQQLGAFSNFLSPERKQAWHRINVEYLLTQSNANQQQIQEVLIQGFQANIDTVGMQNQELANIGQGIEAMGESFLSMAKEIVAQRNTLENSNQLLGEMLESIKNPRAVEAAEKARQAHTNILDAKNLSKDRAKRLLDEAVSLLDESVKINSYDYKAHFDLGWLYSFYLNDLKKAEDHFDTAVLISISHDKDFAIYALRFLADTYKLLRSADRALASINEALELDEEQSLDTQYEQVKYLINTGKTTQAVEILEQIIKEDAIYYTQTLLDSELHNQSVKESLNAILKEERKRHIEYIKNLSDELLNIYYDVVDKEKIISEIKEEGRQLFNKMTNNSSYLELINIDLRSYGLTDKHWLTKREIQKKEDSKLKIYIKRSYFGANMWGFSDKKTNEVVIKASFDYAKSFSDGLAGVKLKGKWGFINKTGNLVIKPRFDEVKSFSEGLAMVGGLDYYDEYGFIDKTGKFAIEPRFSYAESFSEGLAGVKLKGKWGFIDKTGNIVVMPRFDKVVENFRLGRAKVILNNKWGHIDKTGEFTPKN